MIIAIIEPVGGHGGMNYYDFGLASGLSESECSVILYTSEETETPDYLSFSVKKSFKGIWGQSPKLIRAFQYVSCLIFSLLDAKKNKVEVVHYHFFHYTNLQKLCVVLAKVFGFKLVITAHDVESFVGVRDVVKAKTILSYADQVIAHNAVSKYELVNKITLPSSNVSVIPHGNYLDSINEIPTKKSARASLGILESDKVLLFFGQIKTVKGLDILLLALVEAIKIYPDLKLVIAGKVWKDDFSVYEKIIAEKKLEAHVVLHIGYIPDQAVANYYCAADLVVLPYRKIYQSGVLLMAMSYKTPVLTSDIQGMTEIVSHNKNGYTFASENISSLSAMLVDVFNHESNFEEIGCAGYQTVFTDYSWAKIGTMTSTLYKEITCGK